MGPTAGDTSKNDVDAPAILSGGSTASVGRTELAVRHSRQPDALGHRAFHDIVRTAADEWVIVVGDARGPGEGLDAAVRSFLSDMRTAASRGSPPTAGLDPGAPSGDGRRFSYVLARIQLDVGGAWATVSAASNLRPIVLRGEGWVERRSNGAGPEGGAAAAPADDRILLGPGDALVLFSDAVVRSGGGAGTGFGDAVLADVVLDAAGQPAEEVAASIVAARQQLADPCIRDETTVLVLRVPASVRHEGDTWVATSTGVAVDQLRPPVPAGDDQVRGRQPAPPASEALLRLDPLPPSIPELRRLLRRLLRSWCMDTMARDDVELLATEVATNAFARTASPVTVIVKYSGTVVRVEIGDGERLVPRRRRVNLGDLGGHRLALVESVATDWGVSTTSIGSRMWFEVAVDSGWSVHR